LAADDPPDRGFVCPDCGSTNTFTDRDPDPREEPEPICGDCRRESFVKVPAGAA